MNTRQLSSHYEVNQHYLQQDIRNAISLIVDNMEHVSDAQLRVIREEMDDEVLKGYAVQRNHIPGQGYQPIARAGDPVNPQPPKRR